MNILRSTPGHILKILTGNASASALGFVSLALTARWLGPDLQGVLEIMLVYPLLAQQVSEMGIRQVAARAIGQGGLPAGLIVGTVLVVWAASGFLGIALTFTLLAVFGSDRAGWGDLLLASSLLPFMCVQSYVGGLLIGAGRIHGFVATRWVPACINVIGIGAAYITLPADLTVALAIRLAALLASAAILFRLARSAVPEPWQRPDIGLARRMGREGAAFAAAMFLVMLNYRVGLLALEWTSTPHQLGLFSVAQQTAEIVWQVAAAFGTLVFANSLRSKDDVDTTECMHSMRRTVWISAGLGVAGMAVAPVLMPLAFGSRFAGAALPFMAIMPGIVAMAAFKIARFDMVGRGHPWHGIWAVVTGVAVNAAASAVLAPKLGATGAAVGCSLGYACTALFYVHSCYIGPARPIGRAAGAGGLGAGPDPV